MPVDLPLHANEQILRTGGNIFIKSGRFRLVLTDERIFLISDRGGRPGEIDLDAIESVRPGWNAEGDPSVSLGVIAGSGELRTLILSFARDRTGRTVERDAWVREISRALPARRQSPQSAGGSDGGPAAGGAAGSGPVYCSRCGKAAPPDAAFCDRCGSRIVPSGPPQVAARQVPAERPIAVPGRRKYQDIPLVSPDTVREQVRPGTRKPSPLKQRRSLPKKAMIAAAIVIAVVALVLIIAFTGMAGPVDFLSWNMSGNATPTATATATPSATVTPEPATPPAAEALPEETAAPAVSDPPEAVFDQYVGFHNAGDAAGLYALLSENAKAANTPDSVATRLATFIEANEYISTYTVASSDVQENSAVLVLDITWIRNGEPVAAQETIPLVRENSQWKLENLIVPPSA
jgi:hypothetical protein